MSKLKIVWLASAIDDLDEIWRYTFQNWSIEQADRYHHLIIQEVSFLSSNPGAGKKIDYLRSGYRSAKVQSHIIFYRHSSAEMEVVRILHESMDIPNRLND